MRKYENLQYGDKNVILKSLNTLADKNTCVDDYRCAFETLGVELGHVLVKRWTMCQQRKQC